ncbi:cupin domain-containing protein [Lichenifustis flavocetrariae]|uniref:Cupin domain-containing protein n=1 Tax=Lichenifustis flavocetrariae TaxID=2949735 RepID=A0AA42CQV3_9HYPH|nr:cupin domain-containing protein [Lichenifustis flavocetrariae]MCW6511822.1 cupin domain-containing protein [Lichenifustis flavocetrariae]
MNRNQTRRGVLTAGATASLFGLTSRAPAATFGDPDEPPQGAINAERDPASIIDRGPQNLTLAGQFPNSFSPPPTDVGDLPQFWASFNNAPRRIQDGGWARQVTQADFQISKEISGVNMRLDAGGVRELHWHQAAEWGYMSYGACRVTVLDPEGRAYVADTKEGDLWYFPTGYPHSLQGLGPDGCEFILCFDSGEQSEYNTLLVTDWIAHTPPDVLALNFGVPAEMFGKIYTHDLWIFQGTVPGPLVADQDAVKGSNGPVPNPFTHALAGGLIAKQTKGGMVQIADSSNFKASTTIAAALVTVHPGGMREMHWHPNADEWQYYIKGSAQMTVFNTGPKAVTNNFMPGDIGYIKRNLGHYIKNVGNSDLVFLEVFKSGSYQDLSLSDWLSHTPPALVAAHLNVSPENIAKWPSGAPVVVPL